MASFEEAIKRAVKEKKVLGCAAIAIDKQGMARFSKAFGRTSLRGDAAPMQLDSTVAVFSCTKLMTAVACLQCVEHGLFTLDEPISRILLEWANLDIVTGFDETSGEPVLRKATVPITLRQLLTHSSGMGYDEVNPLIKKYRKLESEEPGAVGANIKERYSTPLTFEPGRGWDYGPSIDWAGKSVERANEGMSLEDYMQRNIWHPLGMKSTTFRPLSHPDIMDRIVETVIRGPDGTIGADESGMFVIKEPGDDFGGAGIYSCAEDYATFLTSLLRDDGRILRSESLQELLKPQLPDPKYLLSSKLFHAMQGFLSPDMPLGPGWNYALGGIVSIDGVESIAGKGTMWWGGILNSYWIFQPPTNQLFTEFQRSTYQAGARI
ncbi:beta-lactamase [Glonium stellatum]|uniref:Beta-lactamase n=1 Tax=Glonium stellatum TaxID=574774 RepID=A0A8E2ER18_9PEZI|nr:beta-lactamase [Glonium stellatum]